MGDPINGEFEIYTTDNGGNSWVQVPASNIADPLSGEFGVVGYYSAIGNKAWFGTNKGRVYRTGDKGHNWDVSATSLAGRYVDVEFASGLHGIAQDKNSGTGALSETFDGGVTWTPVTISGQVGTTDFCFVPGTENTWISTDANIIDGTFCSFDGGHSWVNFAGNNASQFLALEFVSNSIGWAGGFNESNIKDGMFKFLGSLPPGDILGPVTNLYAVVTGKYVHLEWAAPVTGNVLGYNVYRNDTLLNASLNTNRVYDDTPAPNGLQNYCVTAVYSSGESDATCTDAVITFGIVENEGSVKIYPNPATDAIRIESAINFGLVRMITLQGEEIYSCNLNGNSLNINTSYIQPGLYILQIGFSDHCLNARIAIR